jgi:hypothetical protein
MRSSGWSSPARSARSGLLLGAVLLAVYAVTLAVDPTPGRRLTAAEAHVLLTADSIVSDGDLDVSNQYRAHAWERWYHAPLRPTAAPDAAGRIFEPHGIGLPLLVAPAWALGGVTAVKLWLALLTALAFVSAASLARRLVPEPWASGAALIGGLSPPAVAAATSIRPEAAAAAALAGAAVLALRVRDEPRAVIAFWAALLVAMVPWIGLSAALPAIVVALALARWLRRRQRGLSGFVALEVVLTSVVVFVTIDDRLYGGLTPYAGRLAPGPATGLHDAPDALARLARLGELGGELVRWAPFSLLAFAALWLLWRSRHTRLAAIAPDQVHVEVAATFLALVCGAQVAAATFLVPSLDGPWFDTRFLVPALPFGTALAAWGLRRFPRAGMALGAATIALTVWLLAAALLRDATLAPPRGVF